MGAGAVPAASAAGDAAVTSLDVHRQLAVAADTPGAATFTVTRVARWEDGWVDVFVYSDVGLLILRGALSSWYIVKRVAARRHRFVCDPQPGVPAGNDGMHYLLKLVNEPL